MEYSAGQLFQTFSVEVHSQWRCIFGLVRSWKYMARKSGFLPRLALDPYYVVPTCGVVTSAAKTMGSLFFWNRVVLSLASLLSG